jgi:mRNA interferase MazF
MSLSGEEPTAPAMLRGEIWWVDFDGSGAHDRRPAVVVSNDRANAAAVRFGRGVITVVPVTSNVTNIYPFQVLLPAETTGLAADSKAQAEQIRSVAAERLGQRIGRIGTAELAQLDSALRLHLQL